MVAFDELQPRLVRFAEGELGAFATSAEDLVADAWVSYVEHADEIAQRAQLAWLRETIRNLAVDVHRRAAGRYFDKRSRTWVQVDHDPLDEVHRTLDAEWARGGS